MKNRILGYLDPETSRSPAAASQRPQLPGREHWAHAARSLGSAIAEHPAASLGVALSIGVLLGWLIKRR